MTLCTLGIIAIMAYGEIRKNIDFAAAAAHREINTAHDKHYIDDPAYFQPDRIVKNGILSSIIQVESGGNESAIGDGGLAVGILQIHPVMVEECNRILDIDNGKNYNEIGPFTLEDRYNRNMSVAMFVVYTNYWCDYYDDYSSEGIARRWNGGPKGHLKDATIPYWNKIQNLWETEWNN